MAKDFQVQFSKPVRQVWSHLVTPREGEFAKKDRLETKLLIPHNHPDLFRLHDAALGALQVAHKKALSLDGYGSPFKKGDDRRDKDGNPYEWAQGMTELDVHTSIHFPPRLRILVNGKVLSVDTAAGAATHEESHFYSGAYVVPTVKFEYYKANATFPNGGVTCYINEVLSAGTGERIGANLTVRYADVIEHLSEEAPLGPRPAFMGPANPFA